MLRHLSIAANVAVILIAHNCARAADVLACLSRGEPIASTSGPSLSAGEYQVIFQAERGSRREGISKGTLWLRPTRVNDKSPRTGEVADSSYISITPLYGWLDAELDRVGAPICATTPHPAPTSDDPVYPGVLVHTHRDLPLPSNAKGEVMLTVSTLRNLRNGEDWLDGCGFVMYITSWDGECYRGTWSKFGRRSDGSGRYCLCPKEGVDRGLTRP